MHATMRIVHVLGEVHKPGMVPVGRGLDLLRALSSAGSMTEDAVVDQVRILRAGGLEDMARPKGEAGRDDQAGEQALKSEHVGILPRTAPDQKVCLWTVPPLSPSRPPISGYLRGWPGGGEGRNGQRSGISVHIARIVDAVVILEGRVFGFEEQLDGAGRAVALLADDDLGLVVDAAHLLLPLLHRHLVGLDGQLRRVEELRRVDIDLAAGVQSPEM